MNYYQPTYTLVTQKSLIPTLTQRMGPYHMALMQCLELECISEGEYASDAHTVMDSFDKELVKTAVKHAVEILDMLDILNAMEYLSVRDLVAQWFGMSQKIGKKEYVLIHRQWYERTWERIVLPKTKNKLVTVYYQEGDGSAAGLAVVLNAGKSIKPLANGGRMENRTKITISEQQKFLKGLRQQVRDTDVCEKIRKRSMLIDNRNCTERTPYVNAAALEILGYARRVFVCDAVHYNDSVFFQRIGVPELVSFLQLIEVMSRRGDDPVRVNLVDTRNMRVYYDQRGKNQKVALTIAGMNNQLIDLLTES